MSDTALTERLKEMAAAKRRYGYRRIHVLLRRRGYVPLRELPQGDAQQRRRAITFADTNAHGRGASNLLHGSGDDGLRV